MAITLGRPARSLVCSQNRHVGQEDMIQRIDLSVDAAKPGDEAVISLGFRKALQVADRRGGAVCACFPVADFQSH